MQVLLDAVKINQQSNHFHQNGPKISEALRKNFQENCIIIY